MESVVTGHFGTSGVDVFPGGIRNVAGQSYDPETRIALESAKLFVIFVVARGLLVANKDSDIMLLETSSSLELSNFIPRHTCLLFWNSSS